MQQNPYSGIAIAIDGIDGAAKTTQAHRLVRELDSRGIHAVYTKEPWWGQMTEGDHRLRRAITGIDGDGTRPTPEEIQRLFIDNRQRHLVWEVIPQLGALAPTVVVLDRYCFSTMAYGEATTSLSFEDLYRMHEELKWFFLPDVSFILELPADEALARLHKNPDIFEHRETLERVRTSYQKLATFFKNESVHLIDARGSEDEVFAKLLPRVEEALAQRSKH